MSRAKGDRKNRSFSEKNVPPEGSDKRVGAGRYANAVASALHSEFGGTRRAIKTVVGLTTANQRAVKNWFDGRNGPSGEFLLALCRHSDRVLETFLLLAGRAELVTAKKLVDAKHKLREMLRLVDELEGNGDGKVI